MVWLQIFLVYKYVIKCKLIVLQCSPEKAFKIHTAMKHSGEPHSASLRYSATVCGAEVEAILNSARITENVDDQIWGYVTRCVHLTLQLSYSHILRRAPY